MPLPPPAIDRTRLHQRRITFDGFKRADGLWDIEGQLVDTKDNPFPLHTGTRQPGEPIHDIRVRLTIDTKMNVLDIVACAKSTPFTGTCEGILPDYRKVIGLNLFKGFVKAVKEIFRGTQGCTHLSELLMAMPTAAFQTFAGEVKHEDRRDGDPIGDQMPAHLDGCHALGLTSDVVLRYYPRWYRGHNPG